MSTFIFLGLKMKIFYELCSLIFVVFNFLNSKLDIGTISKC